MKAFAITLSLALYVGIRFSPASAQDHFRCVGPTIESYSIVVTSAAIDGDTVDAGGEVGVFTSDGLCVGAAKLPPRTNIQIAAWKDDPQTPQVVDGYARGDTMRFRIWDNSAKVELFAKPVYQVGNGTFEDGLYAILSLSATSTTSLVGDKLSTKRPVDFALLQNYPNPFNPSTTIRYTIPQSGYVMLKVYNLLGKEMATLVSEKKGAGEYEINWYPISLPSGVYVYRLQVGNYVKSRKLILMK